MAQIAHIWRHPIKAHGREELREVTFEAGKTMPWDRVWAVAHEAAQTDGKAWAPCANFSRGAKAPGLMGLEAKLDTTTETVTLRHADLGEASFHPERDAEALIDWCAPLIPPDRAASARVVRAPDRGMTDTPFPSISFGSAASHRAVEQKLGRSLSPLRWRANLWIEGLDLWEEFEMVGQTLRIGEAEFAIREKITRCLATAANPETGKRDADTLGALDAFGHQEFGIYAEITRSGRVCSGDTIRIL